MRAAPNRTLMAVLWRADENAQAVDPVAMPETSRIDDTSTGLNLCDDQYAALNEADALITCTVWQQFRALGIEQIEKMMRCILIVDGRNLNSRSRLKVGGWRYFSLGRTA
jgi:UDPglucose 6-dehydrogenase